MVPGANLWCQCRRKPTPGTSGRTPGRPEPANTDRTSRFYRGVTHPLPRPGPRHTWAAHLIWCKSQRSSGSYFKLRAGPGRRTSTLGVSAAPSLRKTEAFSRVLAQIGPKYDPEAQPQPTPNPPKAWPQQAQNVAPHRPKTCPGSPAPPFPVGFAEGGVV